MLHCDGMKIADSEKRQTGNGQWPELPDFSREAELINEGFKRIAGIDEAGRGPLAGPVVAAALVLDPERIPVEMNDSKRLSEKKRFRIFDELVATASFSVVCAPPAIIERLNIRGATLWAMQRAVFLLDGGADFALVDGRDIPANMPCRARAVTGGDRYCLSIAAASVIAKVVRDLMCPVMDSACPGYEFARHKGYGTRAHMDQMERFGVTRFHRRDFAPVAALTGRGKSDKTGQCRKDRAETAEKLPRKGQVSGQRDTTDGQTGTG